LLSLVEEKQSASQDVDLSSWNAKENLQKIMDEGDPQTRAVKKGHDVSWHVNFLGDLEEEERVSSKTPTLP
jgi:hypothetical protein